MNTLKIRTHDPTIQVIQIPYNVGPTCNYQYQITFDTLDDLNSQSEREEMLSELQSHLDSGQNSELDVNR